MIPQLDVLETLAGIVNYGNRVFEVARDAGLIEDNRPGCAITVGLGPRNDSFMQVTHVLGNPPAEKKERFIQLSTEKPWRARMHGHIASALSRDPSGHRYAGGFDFDPWTIGISGLTEADDEALALGILVGAEIITVNRALEVLEQRESLKRFNALYPHLPPFVLH